MRAAAADVIELPATCCRIDKEVPVQFVSLCHSGHGLTSFLPETVSAQKSLCFFCCASESVPCPGVSPRRRIARRMARVPAMSYPRPMTGIHLSRCGCPKKFFRNSKIFSGLGDKKTHRTNRNQRWTGSTFHGFRSVRCVNS